MITRSGDKICVKVVGQMTFKEVQSYFGFDAHINAICDLCNKSYTINEENRGHDIRCKCGTWIIQFTDNQIEVPKMYKFLINILESKGVI